MIQYKQPMIEAGYVVDVAETAAEALEFLEMTHYDAYIVDLLLPQEGAFKYYIEYPGFEIIKKMVNECNINPTKIIVFSVVDDNAVIQVIKEFGVHKIFVKRLQPIEFLTKEIKKILEKKEDDCQY